MKLEENAYKRIIESLHDGLYFVDTNRIITYWNRAAEKITGFTAEEVVGLSCSENILTHVDSEGNKLCLGHCPLAATMLDESPREAQVYLHHKDGHRVPISVRVSALTDDTGKVVGGVELFTDISSLEANELRVAELEKLALIDNLTQLANRNFVEKELLGRFEENRRLGVFFGVLFIDIDHFKEFNDTYGHDVGDAVLKCVANNLAADVRPFDLYGRWGGEEFIGIIRNVGQKELEIVGDRIRMLVQNSYFAHGDENLNVTVSIGATLVKTDDTVESLIKRADELMYRSKKTGRNRLTAG